MPGVTRCNAASRAPASQDRHKAGQNNGKNAARRGLSRVQHFRAGHRRPNVVGL